jgi:hypothetical protein
MILDKKCPQFFLVFYYTKNFSKKKIPAIIIMSSKDKINKRILIDKFRQYY